MTTATFERGHDRGNGAAWVVLALLVTLALVGVSRMQTWRAPVAEPPVVELPELTEHALAHADAREAYGWVEQHGQYCKFDCPDGRTRFVCGMSNNRWAVVVVGVAGRLVTAFTADQAYARGIIDECRNPWRMSHP